MTVPVLVVEDGTGVTTANSYATVDEIDTILAVNPQSPWSLLDPTSKPLLAIWATRLIEQRVTWYGKKLHTSSGLSWPRTGVRDKYGICIDDTLVPADVKTAVAVLAEHLINGNPEVVNSSSNVTSIQVDVIKLAFDANLFVAKYPPELQLLLGALGRVRFGRGSGARIIKH